MRDEQQAFLDAVLGRGEAPSTLTHAARGLPVYRGNAAALAAQALAVPFVRLHEAMGATAFASLAWTFWRQCPPTDGDLAHWGETLAAFLAAHAGEESGLPDLARLDWAVHRCERAADAHLDAESLQRLGDNPAESLWLLLKPGLAVVPQQSGPWLVWRAGWQAQTRALEAGEARFFEAVLAGENVAAALAKAEVKGFSAEIDFDFSAWLQAALHHAWLQAVHTTPLNANPSSSP